MKASSRRRARATILLSAVAMPFAGKQLISSNTSTSIIGSRSNDPSTSKKDLERIMLLALPNGRCEYTWPELSNVEIEQTFAASFPGSGARMTRQLIEGITGLVARSDRNQGGQKREVVIKTHYPHRAGKELDYAEDISRGLILLRNPKDAIPSFLFNFNDLPTHSYRAPVEE